MGLASGTAPFFSNCTDKTLEAPVDRKLPSDANGSVDAGTFGSSTLIIPRITPGTTGAAHFRRTYRDRPLSPGIYKLAPCTSQGPVYMIPNVRLQGLLGIGMVEMAGLFLDEWTMRVWPSYEI